MPKPDMVSGFDEAEVTYDDCADMLRDVRDHTFNQGLSSPSPDLVIGDPSLCELLEHIRETTDRDLGISPANSILPAEKAHLVLLLEERALLLLREKSCFAWGVSPSGTGEDSPASGFQPSGSTLSGTSGPAPSGSTSRDGRDASMHRVVDVLHIAVDVLRPATRSVANAPNARTPSELRCLRVRRNDRAT